MIGPLLTPEWKSPLWGDFDPLAAGGVSPYGLPNLAARYDLSDLSSLIYDGSNRIGLASDKSGNSAVIGLVLNGTNTNYGSSPNATVFKLVVILILGRSSRHRL